MNRYSQLKFGFVLAMGALVALALCVQCIRTYTYTDSVVIPHHAEGEAERQVGVLSAAARSAGIGDTSGLGPVIEHILEASSGRVLWMRVIDAEGHLLASGGKPAGAAIVPPNWFERVEAHQPLGRLVDTAAGKAVVAVVPFRLPRPPRPLGSNPSSAVPPGPAPGHRPPAYLVEVAVPLRAVAADFDGLRHNLIIGVIASIALLVALAVIALRARRYIRGRYLESELKLARRVQSDLQPKPQSLSPAIEFAASAVAADHVGGDFYDIFEAEPGQIAIVLGDVSGKGVSAALLVSVLQGALRSSTTSEHQLACERINRMLCERSACERFATLFWGVFDTASSTLRYVNAGHAAPMLVRGDQDLIERLDEGGPVLGLLPNARYSAGTVQVGQSDMLILYSDGVSEAANQTNEEFGEDRMLTALQGTYSAPVELCDSIMNQVAEFAKSGTAPDDRTLMVVRFPQPAPRLLQLEVERAALTAAA
jgi:hypothetical protein